MIKTQNSKLKSQNSRTIALGVILEASLFGSTGVPPVNPFKLKNLMGLGIQVIFLPSSRCFGFGTLKGTRHPMSLPAGYGMEASSMTIAKGLNVKLRT